jgi:hypothetical protein
MYKGSHSLISSLPPFTNYTSSHFCKIPLFYAFLRYPSTTQKVEVTTKEKVNEKDKFLHFETRVLITLS